jgi:hypothetical protein
MRTLLLAASFAVVGCSGSSSGQDAAAADPDASIPGGDQAITLENQQAGDPQWLGQPSSSTTMDGPTTRAEIEGYASELSVAPGESISFHVAALDAGAAYHMQIYRMGYYGGDGGRLRLRGPEPGSLPAPPGTRPPPESYTGMIEPSWPAAHTLTIPTDWLSGIYAVQLTLDDGPAAGTQSFIPFVVRDPSAAPRRDFLFVVDDVTAQAYNSWGGKSTYCGSTSPAAQSWDASPVGAILAACDPAGTGCSAGGGARPNCPAVTVSFARPYAGGNGMGTFASFAYNMVRFLEERGYDVAYASTVDLDRFPEIYQRYDAVFSVGHDEYWSMGVRTTLEAARDAGVHLAFFSGNTSVWQVRFEPGYRAMTTYKTFAARGLMGEVRNLDPYMTDGDASNDRYVTTLFSSVVVDRPEWELVGTMATSGVMPWGNHNVQLPDHWIFAGTGLTLGQPLAVGIGGNEAQKFDAARTVTDAIEVLALDTAVSDPDHADPDNVAMTIYRAASGAWVFCAGGIHFSHGLATGAMSRLPPNANVQKVAENLLARFLADSN